MMLPCASNTRMQCSQRASTPSRCRRLPTPRGRRARHLAGGAAGRRARDRRVAHRQADDRELDARPDLRQAPRLRPLDDRQLAALQHEDAVRALGEHALPRAPRPALVARQRRQRLRPVGDDVVGAEDVLAALSPGNTARRPARPRQHAAQADDEGRTDQGAHGESPRRRLANPILARHDLTEHFAVVYLARARPEGERTMIRLGERPVGVGGRHRRSAKGPHRAGRPGPRALRTP